MATALRLGNEDETVGVQINLIKVNKNKKGRTRRPFSNVKLR
ncbi:hypothetical protein CEV31_0104 [Brucella thiophenivorans]|uniref:Uncharacterized protein n=1 Tax=Brucella thiophenivorans TaxID=571255 RepID=A0A256G8G3_9HYPH|nr:hypothetical protein CEV31_0104 [Brucella thiophenivorans]